MQRPCTRPALQTRVPCRKRLNQHLSSASCAQKHHARRCNSRWRRRVARRRTAPSTGIWSPSSAAVPARPERRPLPSDRPLNSSPAHGLSEGVRTYSSELRPLRSSIKDKAFLCFRTELSLFLLIRTTQGRRTLVGDQL